jgi:acyl dehydratase
MYKFMRSAACPSVFAHGMLSMGFIGQLINDWAEVGNLREFGVRFRAITWPGDVITCKGTVTSKRQDCGKNLVDIEVWAENQKGEKTVAGTATVELPSKNE